MHVNLLCFSISSLILQPTPRYCDRTFRILIFATVVSGSAIPWGPRFNWFAVLSNIVECGVGGQHNAIPCLTWRLWPQEGLGLNWVSAETRDQIYKPAWKLAFRCCEITSTCFRPKNPISLHITYTRIAKMVLLKNLVFFVSVVLLIPENCSPWHCWPVFSLFRWRLHSHRHPQGPTGQNRRFKRENYST